MADKKKSEELSAEELDGVTGGANESPIAASRFGISIDGASVANAELDTDGLVAPKTIGETEKNLSSKVISGNASKGEI